MTRYLILLGLLFFPHFCSGSDIFDFNEVSNPTELTTGAVSLVNIAGLPSATVHGCINVVSGDFQDYECDLVLSGNDPLTFERYYSSSDHRQGSLYTGWFHNHSMNVLKKIGEVNETYIYHVDGPSQILFDKTKEKAKHNDGVKKMGVATTHFYHGLTNTGSGVISGRTNPCNNTLHHHSKADKYHFTDGSGKYCDFEKVDGKLHRLVKTQKTNKNSVSYAYRRNNTIGSVTSKDGANRESGHLEFDFRYAVAHMYMKPWMTVEAHDGRKVTYHFKEFRGNKDLTQNTRRYVLNKVERPNAPWIEYEYHPASEYSLEQIETKLWPDQRYLKIDYYEKREKYEVDGKKVNVKHRTNENFHKVYQLKAPAGTDANPVAIYTFKYSVKEKSGSHLGYTSVFDAYGNHTEYEYCPYSGNLYSISKFNSDRTLACKQLFVWEPGNSSRNLSTILVYDNKNELVFCRHYDYDDANGNALKETLCGNLMGIGSACVKLKNSKVSLEKKLDYYCKESTYTDDGLNLVTYTQELNVDWSYEYYPGTELLKAKFAHSDGVRTREFYKYDEAGGLIECITDNGSSSDKEDLCDVTHRLIKVIENTSEIPMGLPRVVAEYSVDMNGQCRTLLKKTVNSYDGWGRLIRQEIYDANEIIAYTLYREYDDHGNVLMETDPLGRATYRQYDANDNKIFEQGPNPLFHMEYTYDFCNRLIREDEVMASGEHLTKTYRYNYMGNKIGSTDVYGNETRYEYDAFGRVIRAIYPEVLDASGTLHHPVVSFEYDWQGNCISQTDACGNVTKTRYTVYNKPWYKEYSDGSSESFEYLVNGELAKETAKDGCYTCYTTDYFGRPVKVESFDAAGNLIKTIYRTYNGLHLLSETGAAGVTTFYTYDAAGRLSCEETGDTKKSYLYDSLGRRCEERRYFGPGETDYLCTRKVYDLLDRVVEQSEERSDGVVQRRTCYAYDAGGNKSAITIFNDAGASQLLIDYDSHGQPIKTVDGLGVTNHTVYKYDYINDRGLSVPYSETIDAVGNITVAIKNALGHLETEIKKNGMGDIVKRSDFKYDNNGNQIARIDSVIVEEKVKNEIVTAWEYDCFGKIVRLCEAMGTPEQRFSVMEYDTMGRLVRKYKPDGTSICHEYDALGRLVDYGASDGSFHYGYEYDLFDHPVKIVDLLHQTTTLRSYDSNGRLASETCGNGLTIEYEMDHLGRTTALHYPDGSGALYSYEGACVAAVTRVNPRGDAAYSHDYLKYDLMGNCTEAKLIGNSGTLRQQYDLLGRTVSIEAAGYKETIMEYDAVGNIRRIDTEDVYGVKTGTYDYDALNQITSERSWTEHDYVNDSLSNQVVKDGSKQNFNSLNQLLGNEHSAFVYDLNGNLVKKNLNGVVTEFRYDALNRLVEVNVEGNSHCYQYDSFNRRLLKSSGDEEERYLYAGLDEVGLVDGRGTMCQLRVLGVGKGSEIGAAVAFEIDGCVYAPVHTHGGHVKAIVDAGTGDAVETYRYSAFGIETILGSSGASCNPWRFASKRIDNETGFIYFGERYYDPSTSRWITTDPIGFQDGPNLYAYVHNSPLNLFDLYGLEAEGSFCSAVYNFAKIWLSYTDRIGVGKFSVPNPFYNGCTNGVHYNQQFTDSQFNATPSSIHRTEGFSFQKLGIGFVNGMCNTLDLAFESINLLSRLAGGYAIDLVYNPTNDWYNDLGRVILAREKFIGTDSVQNLHKLWYDFFEQAGQNGRYLMYAHSEGTTILRNALMSFPEELRNRIDVVAIAPSSYISDELCGSVVHYCTPTDVIPYTDPYGRRINHDSIRYVHPNVLDLSMGGHSFNNMIYLQPLKYEMDRQFENHFLRI